MATLGSQALTLRDTAEAARKKNGELKANILDLVSEENGVLDDTTFLRADDGDKLSTDFRNYNPHGTWVALGEGVPASKTGFSTAWDTCGRIKARVQIPLDVWDKTKDKEALWQMHVRAISQGMREDVAAAIFYANIANEPRKFNGLTDFYDKYAKSDTTRKSYAFNVLNAGTSGISTYLSDSSNHLRSIWLVGWGDMGVTCFYPEVSKYCGLTVDQMRDMQLADANGNPTWHKTQEIAWDIGLAVRNFQRAGRVCNIQLQTALAGTSDGNTYANGLITHLRHLRSRVKAGGGRLAFYMCESLWEVIEDAFARLTQSNAIKYADLQQSKPDTLWGIPIHLCDCLDTNEDTAVTEVA
jgi:hypothetical protein